MTAIKDFSSCLSHNYTPHDYFLEAQQFLFGLFTKPKIAEPGFHVHNQQGTSAVWSSEARHPLLVSHFMKWINDPLNQSCLKVVPQHYQCWDRNFCLKHVLINPGTWWSSFFHFLREEWMGLKSISPRTRTYTPLSPPPGCLMMTFVKWQNEPTSPPSFTRYQKGTRSFYSNTR